MIKLNGAPIMKIGTIVKILIIFVLITETAAAIAITASDVTQYSGGTGTGVGAMPPNTTWVKVKEHKVTSDYTGSWRITWSFSEARNNNCDELNNPILTHTKIYKNGVAWGTDHSTTSATTASEDFTSLSITNGDLIQIYLKQDFTMYDSCDNAGSASNFAIKFDLPLPYIPPAPTGLSCTYGNFWANCSWSAGAGNITNGYNGTIGGVSINGTTTTYKNVTLSAHANADAYILAYNSSSTGAVSTSAASNSYTLPNSLPVMTGNAITPTTAYTADTLTSSTHTASDADSDSVSFYYQWYEDNVSMSGKTSSTLAPADTTKGKAYKVLVTPNDGYANGTGTYSNEVTIQNTAPTAPTLTSDLGTHETNHTPALTFTPGTDDDTDTVTTYCYVDGTNPPTTLENTTTGSSLVIGSTTVLNDSSTYYARCQSYDGTSWNNTYSAVDTFRMNGKPTVPVLSSPSNLSSDLTANKTLDWTNSTDAEGDSITYNLSVNGSVISTGLTVSQAALVTVYGAYNWTAQAFDGYESSAYAALFYFYNNNNSFNFSNKAASETVITAGSGQSIISLNINDSDGTISSTLIEITYAGTPFYYAMTAGANDSWSYTFKTGAPGTYTITGFIASDNLTASNSTTWDKQIIVVPSVPGGAPGGSSPGSAPAAPAATEGINLTAPDIPSINLRTMGKTDGGANILYITSTMGIGMMVLGAASKRVTKSAIIWGLIILIISMYGLGVIN